MHRRSPGRPRGDLRVSQTHVRGPPPGHQGRARWRAHLLAVVRAQAHSVHRERGEVRRGVHEVGALVPARAAGTREVRCGVACHRERPGGGARATRPMSLNPRSSTVMSTRWGLRLARASAAAPPAAALTTVSLLDPRASDGVEELPVCDLARLFSCAGGVPRPGTSLDGSTRSARATTPVMLSSSAPSNRRCAAAFAYGCLGGWGSEATSAAPCRSRRAASSGAASSGVTEVMDQASAIRPARRTRIGIFAW